MPPVAEPEPERQQPQLGYLEYTELSPTECTGVAERVTMERGRRVAHPVHDGRARPDLALRSCGFELFGALPPAPPRRDAGGRSSSAKQMRNYQRDVEHFVRSKLEDPAHFTLRPDERLGLVMSYNTAVRSTDRRTFGGSDAIRRVHTDLTAESGPMVLRHVLAQVHQWPAEVADRGDYSWPNGETNTNSRAAPLPTAQQYTDAVLSGKRDCRYLFINLWRSMDTDHPVSTWPLALLDPRSWSLTGTDHAIEHSKRAGAIFPQNYVMRAGTGSAAGSEDTGYLNGQPRRQHEWFIYPRMEADEGIMFVNFDSDPTAPQFVFHGACDLETPPPPLQMGGGISRRGSGIVKGQQAQGAEAQASPVRVSVEVRLLVIIERDGAESRVCGTKGLWPTIAS